MRRRVKCFAEKNCRASSGVLAVDKFTNHKKFRMQYEYSTKNLNFPMRLLQANDVVILDQALKIPVLFSLEN